LTVARIVVLDSRPLGLASDAKGKPEPDRCRAWIDNLSWSGVLVIVPEIVDFEVRRELLRTGATAGIRRLDRLIASLIYAPLTTAAMRRAAVYWAQVRRAGLPTASDLSLDADCIVAAQADAVCGHGDVMTIATGNPTHLSRFPGIDAQEWERITP
jgi:predicted nucleic acid-binding protein